MFHIGPCCMAAENLREQFGLGFPPNVRAANRIDQQQVRVRFYNLTHRQAEVIWIDHQRRPIKYARLRRGEFIDLDTFVGHPWIFREEGTGVPLFTHDKQEVFWPVASGNPAVVRRISVGISIGDFTLLAFGVRAVAQNLIVSPANISALPLPATLKDEIRHFIVRSIQYNNILAQPLVPLDQNRNQPENQQEQTSSGIPLKKIARIIAERTPIKNIKNVVHEALKSEPSKRNELFADILNKGHHKEIADAYLDIVLSEKKNVQLHSEDVNRLRSYFLLVGPDSSVVLLDRYVKAVEELISAGYSRNIILILSYFLSTTNILSFQNLRSAVKSCVPELLSKLWSAGMTGEACYLARHFCYVLLAEEMYLGVPALAVWSSSLTKLMSSSPIIALLTCLISCEPEDVECSLSLTSLDVLQRHHSDPILDEREQFRHIVISHFSTLADRLSFPLLVIVLRTVMLSYCDKDNVAQMVQDIIGTRDISDVNVVWRAVMSAALLIIQEELECKKSIQVAASIGAISGLFSKKDVPSDRVFSILQKLFIHNERSNGTFFSKHDCGYLTRAVVAVLNFIPVAELTADVLGLSQVMVFILGTIFGHKTTTVFTSCVRGLSDTLGSSGGIKFFSENWTAALFEHWLPAFVHMNNHCELRCDFYNVLRGFIRSDSRSHEERNGFRFLATSVEDADSCSEGRLARLFAYTDPIVLVKLEKELKIKEFDELMFEINAISLHQAIVSADFKHASVYDGALVERWSVLFMIFNSMTRAQRKILLAKLLPGKDCKHITKLAYGILSGKFKLPDNSRKAVIERATIFFLNIVPGLNLGDDGHPSRLIEWPSLLNINSACPNFFPTLWENSSKEKVRCLLESFLDCVDEASQIEATVVICSIPVEKLEVNAEFTALIANIIERCSEDIGILQLCRYLIKVVSKTTEERDMVNLCLTICATHHVVPTDTKSMMTMSQVLLNLLRFTPSTVNNSQCALFITLLTKHFNAVRLFVSCMNGSVEDTDRLVYGCGKIAHVLTQFATQYSRIVAPIISEIVLGYNQLELAMCRLHSINDKYSSAMLATTLPPTEKLQYSRVFPEIQKSKKKIV